MYALWNLSSGNAVGGFETEEAAWSVVRSAYAAYGPDYVRDLALEVEDDESGESEPIAEGDELLQRVEWSTPAEHGV